MQGEVKTLPAGPAFIPLTAPTAHQHHHPSLRVAAAAQQQQAYGGRQHYQQKYQNANSYYNRTKRKRDSSSGSASHTPLRGGSPGGIIPPWVHPDNPYSKDSIIGLHEEINDFFQWITPTQEEHFMRLGVVARIETCVKKLWPSAKLHIFGSFRTGLYLPTSDIDLALFGEWETLPLRTLEKALLSDDIADPATLKVLDKASVPIIKMTDKKTQVRVDVSFNMVNGIKSVELVKIYKKKYPPLSKLIYVLKQFLLQRDLNEVFTGGLSSYCLILMVVSFLQLHARHGVQEDDANLGVLLLEFFELYGRNFDYQSLAIRVTGKGSYVSKDVIENVMPAGSRPSLLCVEDPLQPGNDVGKSSYGALRVRQAFDYAYSVLDRALHGVVEAPTLLSTIIQVDPTTVEYRDWIRTNFNIPPEVKDGSVSPIPEPDIPQQQQQQRPQTPPPAAASQQQSHDEVVYLPNGEGDVGDRYHNSAEMLRREDGAGGSNGYMNRNDDHRSNGDDDEDDDVEGGEGDDEQDDDDDDEVILLEETEEEGEEEDGEGEEEERGNDSDDLLPASSPEEHGRPSSPEIIDLTRDDDDYDDKSMGNVRHQRTSSLTTPAAMSISPVTSDAGEQLNTNSLGRRRSSGNSSLTARNGAAASSRTGGVKGVTSSSKSKSKGVAGGDNSNSAEVAPTQATTTATPARTNATRASKPLYKPPVNRYSNWTGKKNAMTRADLDMNWRASALMPGSDQSSNSSGGTAEPIVPSNRRSGAGGGATGFNDKADKDCNWRDNKPPSGQKSRKNNEGKRDGGKKDESRLSSGRISSPGDKRLSGGKDTASKKLSADSATSSSIKSRKEDRRSNRKQAAEKSSSGSSGKAKHTSSSSKDPSAPSLQQQQQQTSKSQGGGGCDSGIGSINVSAASSSSSNSSRLSSGGSSDAVDTCHQQQQQQRSKQQQIPRVPDLHAEQTPLAISHSASSPNHHHHRGGSKESLSRGSSCNNNTTKHSSTPVKEVGGGANTNTVASSTSTLSSKQSKKKRKKRLDNKTSSTAAGAAAAPLSRDSSPHSCSKDASQGVSSSSGSGSKSTSSVVIQNAKNASHRFSCEAGPRIPKR